jgi:hypothetical protein
LGEKGRSEVSEAHIGKREWREASFGA